MTTLLALDFPPVSHVIEWPDWGPLADTPFAINKVVLLMWLSALLAFIFVWMAGRDFQMVPGKLQNMGESFIGFIQDGIIMQTIGKDGLGYTPFLGTLFVYILICNVWGIFPVLYMPATARIALPAALSIMVWLVFNVVGIIKNGPLGYLKSVLFPPGVPVFLYILVTPIEFVSVFFVRPLSLAVRLFANMLAGHLLLVSFAVLTTAMFEFFPLAAILPGAVLIAMTMFEVLVVFLQAYIFTILAAVYIGGAIHPEH